LLQANSVSYGGYGAPNIKNSYYGILMGTTTSHLNYMADGSGNGGIYREASGVWPIYYSVSNNCLGIRGSTTASGYAEYINGSSYSTGSYVAASDARKKENIEPIRNALDIVRKMVGVYYTMIDDAQKKRRVGWLAQQTEPILPEIVYYQTDNDAYGINYGDSAAVLAEAIKELADRLDALEAKL